ncbi:MAG: hypothetical protein J1F66_00620 [Clostridiales bacterium]|nr:hypothetical protein [Clostridiales bacterium]
MLINLLAAAVTFFGQEIEWLSNYTEYVWYAVVGIAALFLLIIIVMFFKAIRRTRERAVEKRIAKEVEAVKKEERKEEKRKKKEKKVKESSVSEQPQPQPPIAVVAGGEERTLVGITLDVGVVQRDFKVGDDFNCDGLLVIANYNVAPLQETFADVKVVESSTFDKAVAGKLAGLYICKPDLSRSGKMPVRVCFNKEMALYTISVVERPEEIPAVEEKPAVAVVAEPERVVTGITLDVGVVQRDFKVGDAFDCDGLLVVASFSAAPLQETVANYTVVDASTFDKAVNGSLKGLYVCRPELNRTGKLPVRVCYDQQVALYTISVTERPVEEPKHPEVVVAAQPQEQPQQPIGPREMISLTVNTDYVRRDFYVGDSLVHDGLIVNAHYNREPFKEQVSNFTVIAPDMSRPGNPTVVVMYQDRATSYTVTVRENPYAQQKQPEPQQQVQPQKERVLTRVSVNSDFAKRDFVVGDTFNREGLIVTAHYNVEPLEEQVTNFTVIPPDMSREGMATVMVAYQDRMVSYQINVRPAPVVAKPEPVVEQPKAVRELVSVSLDLGIVQRDFNVGDEFNCDGLLVTGNYSLAPTMETRADFNILDARSFDQIINQTKGCFVAEPDMSVAGRKVVRVSLDGQIAIYTISVHAAAKKEEIKEVVQPAPAVVAEEPKKVERELLSVTLDLGVVQREFEVGDEFNCDGLMVNANYSAAPMVETLADCMIVDAISFDQIIRQTNGLFVAEPNMSTAGRKVVRVSLNNHIALYTIVVREKKTEFEVEPEQEEQPEPQVIVVEQPAPAKVEPERAMLYVTLSTDKVQKDYVLGDNLNTEGLVVFAHFNAEPYMEQVTSYTVTPPDMSHVGTFTVGVHYQDKTVGYQISVHEAPAVEKPEPAVEPQVVVAQQPSQIVVEEESYEGRLRYDRSFNARIIQADDKTKSWYTDVKNVLLSYKKVHGRISWKRETFKCSKAVVAKLAFRGNTLCLLLPLKLEEYADSKYKLEDVSKAPSNADTPAMLRLKNDKSVKQALELIEEVMDDLGIDKDKKYVPEDFYVPYEGVFELIKKGLIKREIKTAADEAVFNGGQSDDESDDDSYELTEVAPGVFVSPKK